MDRFIAMASFRRVAEARSFSAAARHLGLSAAAVTKHIAWLEDDLGARLLHRTTRTVTLSEIGAAYYERCVRILDDLDEAQSEVRSQHAEPRGWLRVNAPVSFGMVHLGPFLARFHERYPEVQVELILDDRHINPIAEGVDVLIRIARNLADSSLVARRLGTMTRLACAAPAYLDRRGRPRRPADLTSHDCIVYNQTANPTLWQFQDRRGVTELEVRPCLSANNSILLRDAAIAGIGVALAPSYVVHDDIATGRLEPILTTYRPSPFDIYALYPRPRDRSARVRAFVELLATDLAQPPDTASLPSSATDAPRSQRATERSPARQQRQSPRKRA